MTKGSNEWGVTFGRITFLAQILENHDNISNVSRERDILFTVDRKDPEDRLRILCCDEYAFGITLLNQALAEFKPLNIIFVGGAWHGYTPEAKDECLQRKMGLYNAQELSGGLWRKDYWAYNRKDKKGNPVFAYKSAGS